MSHSHSSLSNPIPGETIPLGTRVYFRERNRQNVWELLTDEFERSGITQAELSHRTGISRSRVCKALAAPNNLESDTLSLLLFGISGAEPTYGIRHPLNEAARNYDGPDWVRETLEVVTSSPKKTSNDRGSIRILDLEKL